MINGPNPYFSPVNTTGLNGYQTVQTPFPTPFRGETYYGQKTSGVDNYVCFSIEYQQLPLTNLNVSIIINSQC